YLASTGAGGANARDFIKVVGEDVAAHDSLSGRFAAELRNPFAAVYPAPMTRFGPQQDLFAPPPETAASPPGNPVTELIALLDRLRAAEQMPWPDAASAMAEELHAIGLGRQAGAEGTRLVAAILDETERLLALSD
ncbi:MAG TPA: hypothetical protein VIZ17_15135, partial [Acetobacteraceae bacterium]